MVIMVMATTTVMMRYDGDHCGDDDAENNGDGLSCLGNVDTEKYRAWIGCLKLFLTVALHAQENAENYVFLSY